MRNSFRIGAAILAVTGIYFATETAAPAAAASLGESEFMEHCAVCHPQGGNIINPAKTLDKKALTVSGILKPGDIVAKMRNPGPAMTQFDQKTVPDKEATAIAEYILKTFK